MEFSEAQTRRYIIIATILFLILLGLLLLYYLLTRPPESVHPEARPEGFKTLFSIYGFRGDRLYRPTEVAVDKQGRIYVADTYKHRIVVFDKDGRYITQFGVRGKGRGQIEFPTSIAVNKKGEIFVVCKTLNKVVIYTPDYRVRHEIFIDTPLAVSVTEDKLYVTTDRGIMIGDFEGNQLAAFGKFGKAEGQFDFPTGIVVDKKGRIYVADSLNYRIQALNSEGKPLWTVGAPIPAGKAFEPEARRRKFGLPVSLAMDEFGYLYLVDGLNGEIIVFNNKGKEIDKYGEWGHDEGQFYYPAGIAYAGNERFVIADKFNNRVQVVFIPSPAVPPLRRAARVYWPLALLLLLLPPLLWALRRRKDVFLADEAFLKRAINEGKLASIANTVGKLRVAAEVFEAYKEEEVEGIKLSEILIAVKPKQKLVERVSAQYEVSGEEAILLAVSIRRKGRGILLLEKEDLRKIAEEEDLPLLSYEEFIETLEEAEGELEAVTDR